MGDKNFELLGDDRYLLKEVNIWVGKERWLGDDILWKS